MLLEQHGVRTAKGKRFEHARRVADREGETTASSVTSHYDRAYFAWQSSIADFSAQANLWMFADDVRSDDAVIDFGCGGGSLLDLLPGRAKLGVEVNSVARDSAHAKGLETVADLADIPDGWADVIVSCHALEHIVDPFQKLVLARQKLKPGGRAVLVVPCERYDTTYAEGNRDQHLYTWAPVNFGNLVRSAGFTIKSCARMTHRLPPAATRLQKLVGWRQFHALCRAYAWFRPKLTQVRVVAVRSS